MADLTPSERLQPCLLDRLTDEQPESSVEGRDRRVFSLRQVRAAVLRDLAWLLNTPQRLSEHDTEDTPEVRTSVIGYGVPDLCGMTPSSLNLVALERTVARAVKAFEPRIIPATLRVRAVINADHMGVGALTFEIAGDLWAQPVPDPLYLKTDVDLESGQFDIKESTPR